MIFTGCEGKAGMACIACSDTGVDIGKLSAEIKQGLAAFARPLFLRFLGGQLEVTGKKKSCTSLLNHAMATDQNLCRRNIQNYESAVTRYRLRYWQSRSRPPLLLGSQNVDLPATDQRYIPSNTIGCYPLLVSSFLI